VVAPSGLKRAIAVTMKKFGVQVHEWAFVSLCTGGGFGHIRCWTGYSAEDYVGESNYGLVRRSACQCRRAQPLPQ